MLFCSIMAKTCAENFLSKKAFSLWNAQHPIAKRIEAGCQDILQYSQQIRYPRAAGLVQDFFELIEEALQRANSFDEAISFVSSLFTLFIGFRQDLERFSGCVIALKKNPAHAKLQKERDREQSDLAEKETAFQQRLNQLRSSLQDNARV